MSRSQLTGCFLSFLLTVAMFPLVGQRVEGETWKADNANGTYSNPLFFDEFADPDIIRVGADFYLTGSSMHAMPGLAVLHSLDLVNWDFQSYACDKLDLGPEYRLENGKNVYGQGIWAPSFRYHDGTFYIFANVNGKTTQMFRASNPRGPWIRTAMKRGFHDLSVLFDDDGKVYVVWGYRDIRIAQLDGDLTDIVSGTERLLIGKEAGMGEGLHFYKIKGKYYLTSAWYLDTMRMPVARADSLSGPWEVNQNISRGEQFGQVLGWRLSTFRPPLTTTPPYQELAPDPSATGRMAMHQGGIVDTPKGEWWGVSMGEENAIGRVTSLSPVTWVDGWPYFGLPGNPGRTPRTWIRPDCGVFVNPHAPFARSDDFSKPELQPVWQWNHVPVDGKWSLAERPGFLRLHALPAKNIWDAHDTLTQRAVGPESSPTVVMDAAGLKAGDVAGFALFIQPDAWIGIEKEGIEKAGVERAGVEGNEAGLTLVQHDGETMRDERITLLTSRVWLRADCEFVSQLARFSYSIDGKSFQRIGEPFRMVTIGVTFQGVRYALFSFHRGESEGGFADFDSVEIYEPHPHGLTRLIPYYKRIRLTVHGHNPVVGISVAGPSVRAGRDKAATFFVANQDLGRVALRSGSGYLSVSADGRVSIHHGNPRISETFQWIETFTGELTLLSLETHRYLGVDLSSGAILADSPGPEPNGPEGVRFDWVVIGKQKLRGRAFAMKAGEP